MVPNATPVDRLVCPRCGQILVLRHHARPTLLEPGWPGWHLGLIILAAVLAWGSIWWLIGLGIATGQWLWMR